MDADSGATADAGGAGGTEGGAPSSQLGNVCASDSDCGPGLHCALASGNDFGFAGPSRGYCTVACKSSSDCSALFPGSVCHDFLFGGAYCLRGCDHSATNQCFNRYDEVCSPDVAQDGGVIADVCWPACASGDDCGSRKCDLSTLLCTDAPKGGDPVGTPCDPTAAIDPCAGFCTSLVGGSPTIGACSAICSPLSLGVYGACGSDPHQGSPQAAACVFTYRYNNGAKVGSCTQLCNCNGDCLAPGMICESWAQFGVSNPGQFAATFKKQGYCAPSVWVADAGITGIASCSQDGGVDAQ